MGNSIEYSVRLESGMYNTNLTIDKFNTFLYLIDAYLSYLFSIGC